MCDVGSHVVPAFSRGGGVTHAEEGDTQGAYLKFDFLVNGENINANGPTYFAEKGDTVTLSVKNVTVNGETAENVSYQWFSDTEDAIQDADSPQYSFEFEEEVQYWCEVTADDAQATMSQRAIFKEDTLTVKASSTPACTLDEDGNYQIYDIAQGDTVILQVDAQSSAPEAEVNYQWYKYTLWTDNESEETDGKIENGIESTYTLTKEGAGIDLYTCEVSDGNRTDYVSFYVNPVDTMQIAPAINGVTPEPFERGYFYVAKQGEEITMSVNAVSSNADVTYKWVKRTWAGGMPIDENVGASDSVTVTKSKGAEYGDEYYFCYVNDGNEQLEVGIVLFELYPYQVTAEAVPEEETPAISINNEVEELSNYLLKEDLEALNRGSKATIKLTSEKKENIETSEKEKIEQKLTNDSTVGMYLDLNLYKNVEGETEQQITETGTDVSLSIDIPASMENTDLDSKRTYQVVRIHDGEAETLVSDYDSESGKLTFNTDRFSTYAIAYADEMTGEAQQDVPQKPGAADKKEDIHANSAAVQTGDSGNAMIWIVGILLSCCGLIGVSRMILWKLKK